MKFFIFLYCVSCSIFNFCCDDYCNCDDCCDCDDCLDCLSKVEIYTKNEYINEEEGGNVKNLNDFNLWESKNDIVFKSLKTYNICIKGYKKENISCCDKFYIPTQKEIKEKGGKKLQDNLKKTAVNFNSAAKGFFIAQKGNFVVILRDINIYEDNNLNNLLPIVCFFVYEKKNGINYEIRDDASFFSCGEKLDVTNGNSFYTGRKNFIKGEIEYLKNNFDKVISVDNPSNKETFSFVNESNNINNDINVNINNNNLNSDFDKYFDPHFRWNQFNGQDPMIALQNVGATCYMNATLQCFAHVPALVEYFRTRKKELNNVINKIKNEKNDCLTEEFVRLFKELFSKEKESLEGPKYRGKNTNNEYYIPKKFKEKISKMNPLFQGAQANDAKDLVNFLVMQLHEELNTGKKSNNNGEVPQTNENLIFNNFCQTYYYENKSIICDLFYGINGTKYECLNCNTQKYNFQIGFFYIFPLEEVKKYKILRLQQQLNFFPQMQFPNNMMNYVFSMQQLANLQSSNSVSIEDCFDYNQKIEYMVGDNAMYCNTCNRSENATYQNYIANCPKFIIIILNRGQGIQFKIKCEFTEFLNIQNYVRYNNNTSCQYKLTGVVTHMGESGSSGHFVAFCKSPIDDQWYNYNDDLCFLVNDFKGQVIDYAMPYLLFYQKVV